MFGIFQIIKNVAYRKSVYHLQFDHEPDKKWYYHCPSWPFAHHNLMMVGGADKLCAFLSDDNITCKVEVRPSNKRLKMEGYAELVQTGSHLTRGAFYQVQKLEEFQRDIWICPVTLTVLGKYPQFIYVKKIEH